MTTTAQPPALPGLSWSGLEDLAVSPMRMWHLHINPDRPVDKPTPAQVLGSALHCAVLEPARFAAEYARKIAAEDFEECLVTMEDLRNWLTSRVVKPTGGRKADLIAQVQLEAEIRNEKPHILDALTAEQEADSKVILPPEVWKNVQGAAEALRREPRLAEILADPDGRSEVEMVAKDPNTGVMLKARMDWLTPAFTLDLKTFTQRRGKSIDQTIADAIWHDGYHRQAWFYRHVRSLATGCTLPHVIAFVESDEPHEVRLRMLKPTNHGEVSILWEQARCECQELIRLYAGCLARFGDKPWKGEQAICPLLDEDVKGLAYA